MGGMSALAYRDLFPGVGRLRGMVVRGGAPLPFSIALRSLQREIIRSDPEWHGRRLSARRGAAGMRLARKLGMITYRSAAEWRERFGRERVSRERRRCLRHHLRDRVLPRGARDQVHGEYDPNCYLYMSRAMDLFDRADHGGVARRRRRAHGRARADHRCRDGLPVPDRSAARVAPGSRAGVARCSSTRWRRSRATTRSSSTWTASGR